MNHALITGFVLSFCLTAAAQEDATAEDTATPPGQTATETAPQRPVGEPAATYQTTVTVKHLDDPAVTGTTGTTVTRERLEAMPGGDTQPITNFISMQPGVVQDSFGSNLHFRGADGALLYVIDDIPLFSPSVGTVGQLLNTIPTRLVQNLNVLTGGFPVEYSYSLGGVIDIKTRQPTADPTGELQLMYGNYNRIDVAGNYAQQIGKVGILASANFVMSGRGLDPPDAVTLLNDHRIGGNAFVKLRYDITDHDRLDLLGTFQEDQFHVPIDSTMLPLSQAPNGAARGNDVYGDGAPPFTPYNSHPTDLERTFFAALSYRHEGEVSFQASLYAREIYEKFFCDPTRALGTSADPGSTCSNFGRDAYHYGLYGQATWDMPSNNHWKAGIQLDEAPSKLNFSLFTRDDDSANAGPDPTQTLGGGDAINTFTAGLFLEDRIEIGDLTLLPGARIDLQNTTFGSANLPNKFFAGPSVRLGASYVLAESVILHGFVGWLWEAPTNFDAPIIAPLVDPTLAGQKLPIDMRPAKTWSAQVGVAYHPTDKFTVGIDGWGRLLTDWLDHENIGNTALWANFNWQNGWAAGGDVYATGEIARFWKNQYVLEGFGNVSGQQAKQQYIDSLQFLFGSDDIEGAKTWTIMDHVQFWTVNAGLIVHDAERRTNLAFRLNYGSGFHTGVVNDETVPQHTAMDITFSHRFELPVPTTVAVDVINMFNNIYAYRLGTAFFGNSQYAPLRQVNARLIFHFG